MVREVISKLVREAGPSAPGGSLPTFRNLVDELSTRSVRTVLVEYRGYGAATSLGLPSMSSVLADADACFRALEQPESRIVVMGRSIGSLPALSLGLAYPGLAGLVLESSISDACAWVAAKAHLSRAAVVELPVGRVLDPLTHTTALRSLACPLILLHSADDELMPIAAIDSIFEGAFGAQAGHAVPLADDASTGASGGTMRSSTLAARVFLRFGVGGHNMIWPVNWREYSRAVIWCLACVPNPVPLGEGPGGQWFEELRARQAATQSRWTKCSVM